MPRDTIDMDVRVGGHQRLVMVNEQDASQTSPVNATFTEVVENELLVGSEEVPPEFGLPPGTKMHMRLEFHDAAGKTRLVLHQGPYSRTQRAAPAKAGAARLQNWTPC